MQRTEKIGRTEHSKATQTMMEHRAELKPER